ncbi:Putative serine protease HtrA [Anatilimnocola aggregata]|uniref:Serine protease HtrA n=1 Tax=Anatilimnocola aggregata TaxID=2528021 RepID=A0A517YN29_9BACT|nr:PDZ domain-containing protein [Anatilimnocola aggregata]QDU31623.1 Putative serine protease HtrA [Anatilimnocola aggregata]
MNLSAGSWMKWSLVPVALLALAPVSLRATERSHSKVLAAFRDVVKDPAQSTVRVFADGRKAALGAVVDSQGFVITKASELKGKLECQLLDGRRVTADLVGKDTTVDLALLKINAGKLHTIAWSDNIDASVGSWLITPGLELDPVAIGVVSVGARKIAAPSGALGVQLDQKDDVARIEKIMPDSAALRAGMEAGDIVLKVNTKDIKGRQNLIETVRGYMPGERIELVVKRGDKEMSITVTLGNLATLFHGGERAEFQNNLGGPLSERRAGFTLAIQHDTVLRPADCGGPIVDLDGKCLGINIARAGRVESYALPASLVREVIGKLKAAAEIAQKKVTEVSTPAESAKPQ